MASDLTAQAAGLSLTDSVDKTYVWTHLEEESPRPWCSCTGGPIKIFSNWSTSLEGGLALMEDKLKEQVALLELETMFVLCGNLALHHPHPQHSCVRPLGPQDGGDHWEIYEQPAGADVTKLETSMSFLEIKASMGLQEKIRQVRHENCQNRREMARVRLEAISGEDNPYSLLQVFDRGHLITKRRAVAYMTRCDQDEVLPRVSLKCTEEIPLTWNNTRPFVDDISYVIKSAFSPTRCNDKAQPRWNNAGGTGLTPPSGSAHP